MSLLSYNELVKLVEQGVIDAPIENINSSSIDLTLGDEIKTEHQFPVIIDLANKKSATMIDYTMDEAGYVVSPGEFFLATTRETFNLPNDIVAEFVLKSTQARNGMLHALAGYCDPGWHNSKLTMEFYNGLRFQSLLIRPGMKCGQVKFYRVEEVPEHASYAVVGQYNNQTSVTASKGIR